MKQETIEQVDRASTIVLFIAVILIAFFVCRSQSKRLRCYKDVIYKYESVTQWGTICGRDSTYKDVRDKIGIPEQSSYYLDPLPEYLRFWNNYNQ